MPRITLSIDSLLLEKLEKAALLKSTTANLLIIDTLEELYTDSKPFNYSAALKTLIEEAEAYAKSNPEEKIFSLITLNSFTDICVARAGKVKIQPSMVRARLGKMFNAMVRKGNVSGVSRAKDTNGKNKFIENSAAYCVD